MHRLLTVFIVAELLFGADPIPKFEDYSISEQWTGPNAAVKLVRPDERMFRTHLTKGALEEPDFAGHYRFVGWGCGSACAAGALIDLKTGIVYPPPKSAPGKGWDRWIFTGGIVNGSYLEVRPDSSLAIVRQQARNPALQEVFYYQWQGSAFRLLTKRVEAKEATGGATRP